MPSVKYSWSVSVSSSWSTGSKIVCVATTIKNPDNGTMASAGGIGASEGDVKVEGDNVGAMGAPVTRPRLTIDGAVDGELDGTEVGVPGEQLLGRGDGKFHREHHGGST